MPRTFRHLDFGPLALRDLLRARLAPGERVVGWASAQLEQPLSLALFRLGLMVLPGVGHVVSGLLSSMVSPERSLLILTDARLLLITAHPTGAHEPAHDIPLEALSVKTGRFGITFELADGAGPLGPHTIDAHQSPPAARLHRALVMLARVERAE